MSPAAPEPTRRARLPPAVIALGLTSLFTDVSSEMILPLLPLLLASMQASATALGLIEGAAEATASFLKLGSGWLSDRVRRRKPLVVFGYVLASVARPLVALAASPAHVLAVRVVDRIGKGVRTAPRDVLIAAAAPEGQAGRAFGFHRAMDHAGAVVGPLAAAGLLALGVSLRGVFALAAIPAALAVLCVITVREPSSEAAPPGGTPAPQAAGALPRPLPGYLAILALFSLGNSTDTFLLLQAQRLGVPVESIPLLWALLHVSKVVSSALGGEASDRIPRPRLIALGWIVYALSYLGLGLATAQWQVWALFAIYGAYHGLTEPAEKALVKDLAPEAVRGRAFGAYHFVVGITAIPAGLVTGWLWDTIGPLAGLGAGAALALAAAIALVLWQRRAAPPPGPAGSVTAGARDPR